MNKNTKIKPHLIDSKKKENKFILTKLSSKLKKTKFEHKKDSNILVIEPSKAKINTVQISGSKHSALQLLGALPIIKGDIEIADLPDIEDINNVLEIYKSFGISVTKRKNITTISTKKFVYDDSVIHLSTKLRSSILMLGSVLIRNKYISLPRPGGDQIEKGKVRSTQEFITLLKLFGIDVKENKNKIIARITKHLNGNKIIDLADKKKFPHKSGSNRTALAIILATGNIGKTEIKNPLKAAEIDFLVDSLERMGVNIYLNKDNNTLVIYGNNLIKKEEKIRIVITPDKCEIIFWIIYACLLKKSINIKFNPYFKNYMVSNLGPLYSINETIFSKIGIKLTKKSENVFNIKPNKTLKPYDLFISNPETEYDGKILDAAPYFITLFTQITGKSKYLDGKFGSTRVMYGYELNKLGSNFRINPNTDIATIKGKTKLDADFEWIRGEDIRGAGALLLALLKINKKNVLIGANHLERGNDYIDKLKVNGIKFRFGYSFTKDDLAYFSKYLVKQIRFIKDNEFGIELENGDCINIKEVTFNEVFFSLFLHPSRMGAQKIYSLSKLISKKPWNKINIKNKSSSEITLSVYLKNKCTNYTVLIDKEKINKQSDLKEFISIKIKGINYFATRCMTPLKYSIYLKQIKKIISNPNKKEVPLLITIGISHRCNFACSFCYAANNKNGTIISKEKLLSSIEEFSNLGIKVLRFCGNGEATIHPNFMEAILLAKASGMGTFIITNGSTLDVYPKLFNVCFDFLRVSMNTNDEKKYQELHKVDNKMLDRVKSGLTKVNGNKKILNKNIITGLTFVLDTYDYFEMEKMILIGKEFNVNFVFFKENDYNRIDQNKADEIRNILKNLSNIYETNNFKIVPEIFRYDFKELNPEYYNGEAGCLVTGTRCIVDANGDVMSCAQRGKKGYALWGNINNNSFKDIIFSKERIDADKQRAKQGKVCELCLFKDIHLALSKSLE